MYVVIACAIITYLVSPLFFLRHAIILIGGPSVITVTYYVVEGKCRYDFKVAQKQGWELITTFDKTQDEQFLGKHTLPT